MARRVRGDPQEEVGLVRRKGQGGEGFMMAGAIAGLFMVAVLPLCAHASAAGGVAGTASAERRGGPQGLDARTVGGAVLRLRGGKTGGIKARDIWTKPLEELSQMEEDLRLELMSLRVAQQVGGQPGRVNQIKKVRKSIARVLTVATAKRRAEAFESVKNDKFKPLDARKNRNLPKAMRQRLNKYERTRMSNKAVRCLRLKIWGAGVRPMRRIVLSGPLDEVQIGHGPLEEERTFEKYPARKRGQHGKKTHTGHIPNHAQMAMDKAAAKRKKEKERIAAFKAKYADED